MSNIHIAQCHKALLDCGRLLADCRNSLASIPMHILLAAAPGLVRDGIVRVVSELGASVDVRCIDDLKATSPHGVPQLVVLDGDLDTEPANAVQAVHDQYRGRRVKDVEVEPAKLEHTQAPHHAQRTGQRGQQHSLQAAE